MSNQDGHWTRLRRMPTLNGSPARDAVGWGLVQILNERFLELMVRQARLVQEGARPAVSLNRSLWCNLDTAARKRAANSRLLLLDINFADPVWWLAAAENQPVEREAHAGDYLPPEVARELARDTMTLAWLVAREDLIQAIIFFGMVPRVASLIASFSPSDLEYCSARYHQQLRLRFDDQPAYWRMHLIAATRPGAPDSSHLQDSCEQSMS